ncbi:nuclear transport factor 2 family protein [Pandoraea terrae]
MVDSATMKAALREYVEAFNAGDAARVCALYADHATVEDPVGAPRVEGRAAIEAFYAGAIKTGARLALVAPPRGSHGRSASITFQVQVTMNGHAVKIDVTDVMTFDDSGKIERMQAFWAPDDVHPA